eukprot:PhM_4_TR13939/c0_g1_i1/m.43568
MDFESNIRATPIRLTHNMSVTKDENNTCNNSNIQNTNSIDDNNSENNNVATDDNTYEDEEDEAILAAAINDPSSIQLRAIRLMHHLPPFRHRLRQLFYPSTHNIALIENAHMMAGIPLALTPEETAELPFEWFETVVLFFVLANTLQLAFESETAPQGNFSLLLERIYLAVFTFEVVIRMLCFGVWSDNTSGMVSPSESAMPRPYFKDAWNIFDLIIVTISYVTLIAAADSGIGALRAMRVMRPLRSVRRFPSIRMLVSAILGTMRKLLDVAFLLSLFFICFGVLGLQQFKGKLLYRCVHRNWWLNVSQSQQPFLCPLEDCGPGTVVCQPLQAHHAPHVNLPPFYCPWSYNCTQVGNPNLGMSGFDNIFQSMLTLTAVVSLDSWSYIMYWCMQGTNSYAAIYFVFVVIIGAFFIINLTVVVTTISVDEYRMQSAKGTLTQHQRRGLGDILQQRCGPWYKRLAGHDTGVVAMFARLRTRVAEHPTYVKLQRYCLISVIHSAWFPLLLAGVIIANMIIYGTEHYGMSSTLEMWIDISNWVFKIFYTVELFVRIAAEGLGFFTTGLNMADALIIAGSWLDSGMNREAARSMGGFRTSRIVVRVIRLTYLIPSLSRWISIIISSMASTFAVITLIFMLMFIFSSFGKDTLAARFKPDSRMNFDSLPKALLSSFQIMTGEDWSALMYQAIDSTDWWMAIPFLLYFFFARYLMINLFVAVLLATRAEVDAIEDAKFAPPLPPDPPLNPSQLHASMIPEPFILDPGEDPDATFITLSKSTYGSRQRNTSFEDGTVDDAVKPGTNESILHNSYRTFIQALNVAVVHPYFDIMVTLAIVLASVCMALDYPSRPPDSLTAITIRKIDTMVTIIFVIEIVCKVLCFGLGPYLRSSYWNVFDAVAVMLTLMGLLIAQFSNITALRYLKVILALRPVRFLQKVKGLHVVFTALIASIPALFNILIISSFVWYIWGVTGVQLFKGRYHRCSDSNYLTKVDCLAHSGNWENAPNNFDHIGQAVLTLYIISTLEGWVPIMFQGVDAYTDDEVRVNHSPVSALYFVFFIIIGCFYMVTLFVGVLVDTYDQEKQKSGMMSVFVTREQNLWIDTHKRLFRGVEKQRQRMYITPSGTRQQIQNFVTSVAFTRIINLFVALNIFVMAAERYPDPKNVERTLNHVDTICACVFILEAILKLTAYGMNEYFLSTWNRYDFLLAVASIPGMVAAYVLDTQTRIISALRIVRVIRVLRVMRDAESINNLLRTFVLTLPSLSNIAGLLSVVYFVFAIISVALFGTLKRGTGVTRDANFETFPTAVLTLFRMSTGESWHEIMNDCALRPPNDCVEQLGECGHVVALIFFPVFTLLATHILLNLFITVMMDSFNAGYASHGEKHVDVDVDEIDNFHVLWTRFDRASHLRIPAVKFDPFMLEIQGRSSMGYPPGVDTPTERIAYLRSLHQLRAYDDDVYLSDVMNSLVMDRCSDVLLPTQKARLQRKTNQFCRRYHPSRETQTASRPIAHYLAAMRIQSWWRVKLKMRAHIKVLAEKKLERRSALKFLAAQRAARKRRLEEEERARLAGTEPDEKERQRRKRHKRRKKKLQKQQKNNFPHQAATHDVICRPEEDRFDGHRDVISRGLSAASSFVNLLRTSVRSTSERNEERDRQEQEELVARRQGDLSRPLLFSSNPAAARRADQRTELATPASASTRRLRWLDQHGRTTSSMPYFEEMGRGDGESEGGVRGSSSSSDWRSKASTEQSVHYDRL